MDNTNVEDAKVSEVNKLEADMLRELEGVELAKLLLAAERVEVLLLLLEGH